MCMCVWHSACRGRTSLRICPSTSVTSATQNSSPALYDPVTKPYDGEAGACGWRAGPAAPSALLSTGVARQRDRAPPPPPPLAAPLSSRGSSRPGGAGGGSGGGKQ
jgi:hypothetical protein